MPIVSVYKHELDEKLGDLTVTEFEDLLFEYGLELDDVTSEYDKIAKEQGEHKAISSSTEVIYKVEIPANRYDLLCVEGLTRTLSIFKEKIKTPHYVLSPEKATVQLFVDPETAKVRPYVVAAILRNVDLNQTRYDSFIQLQDKIHANIGRKRSLVSVGTHDLDTLTPPFYYRARKPEDIKFQPLNSNQEYTAAELMVLYDAGSHLKPYLPIIRDCEVYPIIEDSNDVICSLPPIINGDHSKISLNTTNIFIEITATSHKKAIISLDQIVTMFSEYCKDPFKIEPVEVITAKGQRRQYPELNYRTETISAEYINKYIGIDLKVTEMTSIMERMGLSINTVEEQKGLMLVDIPPTKHDILHNVDIAEEVAVGYGFSKISGDALVPTNTVGGDMNITKVTDNMSDLMVAMDFCQALPFILCSEEDVSYNLLRDNGLVNAVKVANPKNKGFNVVRNTLLCGLMNTIRCNQHLPLPLRIFEVQDVAFLDPTSECGSRNERFLSAVIFDKSFDLEVIYNVLNNVLNHFNIIFEEEEDETLIKNSKMIYSLDDQDIEAAGCFVKSCSSRVLVRNPNNDSPPVVLGYVGLVDKECINRFKIKKGNALAFEITVENFV